MKEIVKILGRRYSSVSTNDNTCELNNLGSYHKSFQSNRKISERFSIVDSFFNKREHGKRTRSPKRIFLLMASGIMAICAAIVMYLCQPYDLIFKWKLIFEDGGEIFDLWAKPPVDLYVKIYLFNITNKDEFIAGKEKLKVVEVGPYVYKELLTHDNVSFNLNGTLTTYPHHPLEWQEHLSEGNKEDDLLMLPNIALLSIAQVAAEKSYFARLPINILIRQTDSQPVVQMTAKEFMFGYETTITTLGNTFMPDWITFEKVGLIDRMYDFEGDVETIFTGSDDPGKSGLYDTFRGSQDLPHWQGKHCSSIHLASDGTKFKSFIEPNDTLLFYRKSMCRPQRMIRTGGETEASGLKAYKYIFEENALDNGAYNSDNKCFCREGHCLPRGLIDVKDCYYGFPIALSYPHFLDSDPSVTEKIEGTTPNYEHHHSFFKIQPLSGLPLNVSVKFQINMNLKDLSDMAHVSEFSNIIIPMLWFEITMSELPTPLKNRFNLYLNILPVFEKVGMWLLLIGGTIFLLMAVTRAVLGISARVTNSQKMTKLNKKYNGSIHRSDIYAPCEENMMDGDNERSNLRLDDEYCDVELVDERKYILEQDSAISDNDDESNTCGSGSSGEDELLQKIQKTDRRSSLNIPKRQSIQGERRSSLNVLQISKTKMEYQSRSSSSDDDDDVSSRKKPFQMGAVPSVSVDNISGHVIDFDSLENSTVDNTRTMDSINTILDAFEN